GSLLVAPTWLVADHNTTPTEQLPRLLPMTLDGWSAEAATSSAWQPVFEGVDVTQRAIYSNGADTVEAYAALYADQHQGKELVAFKNSILGESLVVRRRASSVGEGPWMATEATDSRGDRWLIWHAYRLDAHWYERTLPLQIQYGVRSLFSAPLSAIVAVRTRCEGEDCSAASDALREMTTSLASALGR
ncbi:exosortase-associated EpsI family protein, partial [Steroidobacter sp.]|uniref:exosortase-associated EpsI family protein n=1 Tax=Steroidobacter sp. TaxID=1978227 RepID=UPI001A5C2B62